MKILYGIQGTGNGHITRARVMAKNLNNRGIDVDYMFSGRPADKYFDMEVFAQYKTYHGLTFHSENGKVNYLKTASKVRIPQLIKDIKSLDMSQYDLVINDFEPISAWAARKAGVPVINISHQAVFTKSKVPVKGMSLLNKFILKYFAPCDISIGVHWFHYGQTIIPPFIEREHYGSERSEDILVYMPFENVEAIKEILNNQHNHNFIVYHPDIKEAKIEDGIDCRPPSREGFLADLSRCNGVIANAGFELSSEALCLGKKILLKPLEGQFEQLSNAETLSQLGLANVMFGLDEAELDSWLQKPANDAINYPSDPTPLIDWILAGDYKNPENLVKQLWDSVSVPAMFTQQEMAR